MAKAKKIKKMRDDGILFCGENAEDVTGSCTFIRYAGRQILLECGLHQSSSESYLDAYNINTRKFPFEPNELDYVFVAHAHIDHCGLLPRLVKEGFKGKIILNNATAKVAEALIKNSSYILAEEARIMSKRYGREYEPVYDMGDVERMLDFFYVYDDYDKIYVLDDRTKFQWLTNSHCVGACQLQLILNNGINTKKILYTSDIGAIKSNNSYVNQLEIPDYFNDVVIMESTYGNSNRIVKKTRDFDVEHLRVAIDTVVERGGTLLLPAFSFARTQELLTVLYRLFGQDKSFDTPIIVDSMLSCEICEIYNLILDEESYKRWRKVYSWDNVRYIVDKVESKACIADKRPKIVISSSGFCTNGRVVGYLEKYLRDTNSMIVFSGFTGNDPSYLSYRIKNGASNKTININKKPIPNKADVITMTTFSSHANYNDLIEYGSSMRCENLVLVHGDTEAKENLRRGLKDALSKKDKTFKVINSYLGMTVSL